MLTYLSAATLNRVKFTKSEQMCKYVMLCDWLILNRLKVMPKDEQIYILKISPWLYSLLVLPWL